MSSELKLLDKVQKKKAQKTRLRKLSNESAEEKMFKNAKTDLGLP